MSAETNPGCQQKAVRQYDVFLADLPVIAEDSHITNGPHYVVVISNNAANRFSEVISVVPLTSKKKKKLPTHVALNADEVGLWKTSTAMAELTMPIDKKFLRKKMGVLAKSRRAELRNAVKVQYSMAE